MVQFRMVQYLHYGMNRTSFWIVSAINQALDPRVYECASAHRTRFNCSKELAVAQAMITNVFTGIAKRYHFRVGGWIGISEVGIPSAANDFILTDDDCADGNFSGFERALRATKSFFHPKFVSWKSVGCRGIIHSY